MKESIFRYIWYDRFLSTGVLVRKESLKNNRKVSISIDVRARLNTKVCKLQS